MVLGRLATLKGRRVRIAYCRVLVMFVIRVASMDVEASLYFEFCCTDGSVRLVILS
jgi:hypothetical protein